MVANPYNIGLLLENMIHEPVAKRKLFSEAQ